MGTGVERSTRGGEMLPTRGGRHIHRKTIDSRVHSCVEGFKSMSYNPIILFKPQGKLSPSMDTIGMNDFVMCRQTEFQQKRYDEYVWIHARVDTTYGRKVYDSISFDYITCY